MYLSSGILLYTNITLANSNNACCICTKKWDEMFNLVYQSGVVSFLEFLMLTRKFPVDVDYKDPISSLMVGSSFLKETVLGGRHVKGRKWNEVLNRVK
jgi:hypothetical protein